MPETSDDRDKIERARQTYAEVLDATKHQDDKINRFLVAIAFLTTGTIAFLLRSDVLEVRHVLGRYRLPLVAIAASVYLGLAVAAVVLLMLALSSELRLPGRRSRPWDNVRLDDSFLYFHMIASRPVGKWMSEWEQPVAELDGQLWRQYVRESHNIAERARTKYGRTDEAAALFVLALMFLSAGFLLAISALTQNGQAHAGRDLAFGGIAAALLGAVLGVQTFLLLYNVYRYDESAGRLWWETHLRKPSSAPEDVRHAIRREHRLQAGLRFRMFALPVYVGCAMALTVTHGTAHAGLGGLMIALALGCGAASVLRLVPASIRTVDDWLAEAISLGDGLVLITIGVAAVLSADPLVAFVAAVYPPVSLSVLTLLRQAFEARRARRTVGGVRLRSAEARERHAQRVAEMTREWRITGHSNKGA